LASNTPMIWSRSSPITGYREWPDSTTMGRISSGGSSRLTMIICERGTMMSRTCSSTTRNTPSSISCASASMMPRSRA
jgi:hypothetical protein